MPPHRENGWQWRMSSGRRKKEPGPGPWARLSRAGLRWNGKQLLREMSTMQVPTSPPDESDAAPGWKSQVLDSVGHTEIACIVQYITQRRCCEVPRPAAILLPSCSPQREAS